MTGVNKLRKNLRSPTERKRVSLGTEPWSVVFHFVSIPSCTSGVPSGMESTELDIGVGFCFQLRSTFANNIHLFHIV